MIYLVIWLHFVADFIFQTRNMAKNKSSSLKYLSYHCLEYTIFLLPIGLKYAIINGVLHFMVDFITSKLTKKAYESGKEHLFFILIGLDQAIHLSILIYTLEVLT